MARAGRVRPGSPIQWVQAAAGAIAFFLLATLWSVASPPLSAADDNFHLTSIVCVQGSGPFCERVDEVTVRVPLSISDAPCYIKEGFRGADCFRWHPEPVETTHWNRNGEHVPQPYYWTMSRFLGLDLWSSIITMRITNAFVASILLFGGLALLSGGLRTAFALAWLVTMVPVGIFHIASMNPSAWATAGIATFWAFLLGALSARNQRPWLRYALIGFTVISGLIAIAGRSDSVIYIGATVLAVSILRWRTVKGMLWYWLPLGALIVIGLILGGSRIARAIELVQIQLPNVGDLIFEWAPRFHLSEWPLLVYYVFGGSTPVFLPYEVGYTMGVGWDKNAAWLPTEFPAVVGFFGVGAAAIAVGLGLTRYSARKIVTIAIMVVTVFTMSFGWTWLSGFIGWPQARYYVGAVVVAVGFSLLSSRARPLPMRRMHAVVIGTLTGLAGAAALATVVRKTTNGQSVPGTHWLEYESYIQWWWWNISELPVPHPNVLVLMGALASIVYSGLLSYIAYASLKRRGPSGQARERVSPT